jgi:hypothetical protein
MFNLRTQPAQPPQATHAPVQPRYGGNVDIEKWYALPIGTHITYDIVNKPGLDGIIINKWIPDQGQFKGKHFFKMEGKGKYTWSLMLEDVQKMHMPAPAHGQQLALSHSTLSHSGSQPTLSHSGQHSGSQPTLSHSALSQGATMSSSQMAEKIESMEKEIQILRKNLANLVAAVTGLIIERRPQVKQL